MAEDTEPVHTVACMEADTEVERAWDKAWDMAWNRKVDTVADTVSDKAVDSRKLADKADMEAGTTMDRVWDRKWDRWRWDSRSARSKETATGSSNSTQSRWRRAAAPTSIRSAP